MVSDLYLVYKASRSITNKRVYRWALMLSVNSPYSIVFNVETLKILLFTVIEDLAVKLYMTIETCITGYFKAQKQNAQCRDCKIFQLVFMSKRIDHIALQIYKRNQHKLKIRRITLPYTHNR